LGTKNSVGFPAPQRLAPNGFFSPARGKPYPFFMGLMGSWRQSSHKNINHIREFNMGFGRGLLLWLLGIPLPIIIILALFWR
jgi:hypothetical protein